jgi:hypothetical protein
VRVLFPLFPVFETFSFELSHPTWMPFSSAKLWLFMGFVFFEASFPGV